MNRGKAAETASGVCGTPRPNQTIRVRRSSWLNKVYQPHERTVKNRRAWCAVLALKRA